MASFGTLSDIAQLTSQTGQGSKAPEITADWLQERFVFFATQCDRMQTVLDQIQGEFGFDSFNLSEVRNTLSEAWKDNHIWWRSDNSK